MKLSMGGHGVRLGETKKKKHIMKNMIQNVGGRARAALVTGALLASAAVASATDPTLDASVATAKITEASGYAVTILAAGLGISGLFLVSRLLRKGMRSVG